MLDHQLDGLMSTHRRHDFQIGRWDFVDRDDFVDVERQANLRPGQSLLVYRELVLLAHGFEKVSLHIALDGVEARISSWDVELEPAFIERHQAIESFEPAGALQARMAHRAPWWIWSLPSCPP